MKMINKMKKFTPRMNAVKLTAGGGLMSLAVAVNAAVPAEVTSALGEAKTDAVTVAGLVLGISVAIFGFIVIKRVMR